jgi:hypothetical protein
MDAWTLNHKRNSHMIKKLIPVSIDSNMEVNQWHVIDDKVVMLIDMYSRHVFRSYVVV